MLRAVSFRTLLRGPAGSELRISESAALPAGSPPLPGGAAPAAVWELPHFPGSVQGEIRLEFSVPDAEAAGEGVLVFVRSGGGWESRMPESSREDGGGASFSVTVPPAQAYAVAPGRR